MCGIAGWVNLDKNRSSQGHSEAVLHSMCESIVHRGPDSEGLWLDASVALGMRRLSIIDLHTGEQTGLQRRQINRRRDERRAL